MTAPRLQVDLEAVTSNARCLVEQLAPVGISVAGVVKAALGSPAVGQAMLAGGVVGLADSRVENLERLRGAGVRAPLTLTRSPMLSQVSRVVRVADISLNSEPEVVMALSAAAASRGLVPSCDSAKRSCWGSNRCVVRRCPVCERMPSR